MNTNDKVAAMPGELRQARQALYVAVATLPFDVAASPPAAPLHALMLKDAKARQRLEKEYNAAVAAFTNDCKVWIAEEYKRRRAAKELLGRGLPGASYPIVTVGQIVGLWSEQWAHEFTPEWMLDIHEPTYLRNTVLERRRLSLRFCAWLDGAIECLETALLPAISITKGRRGNSWTVTVSLAGSRQEEHSIGQQAVMRLCNLNAGATVVFPARSTITRMPYLRNLLIDGDPPLTAKKKPRKRLVQGMVGRITGC